jgi:hypothetical protein
VGTGVLTLSVGLASFQINDGRGVWLIVTSNKVLPTVTGDGFEMTNRFTPSEVLALGDLELERGSKYKFIDSRRMGELAP